MEKRKSLKKLINQSKEIRNLKASLDIAGSNKGVTNVDLLKRISDLEKVVYGE